MKAFLFLETLVELDVQIAKALASKTKLIKEIFRSETKAFQHDESLLKTVEFALLLGNHKLKFALLLGNHKLEFAFLLVNHKLEFALPLGNHKLEFALLLGNHKLEFAFLLVNHKLEFALSLHLRRLPIVRMEINFYQSINFPRS